ncbi:MAG: excinuclease ABC subunit UvrC [Acidobacteria bacterium ACB1]|nr:UvrABC system protein C [Pyrinomonadaceae bacterium]MCE7962158.1 excinuclease ABC subunit UvrC [Acidobacteria bacterium ACB1]RIJ92724.1 MAG: excinuclease ABC subunit C [Acidobacteriota bacterium]
MTIAEKLKTLPTAAGIYIHKNAAGKIIYVGKAKNLRNRVRSYFHSSRNHDPKTRQLVRLINDFEFIVVDNEVEALVLESNLIKKFKPRFNVLLKDDKSYPHLKLTNEPFPKVVITRKIVRDGSFYFGPFLPASLARKTLNLVNRAFQLRTCDIEIDGKLARPCLEYHLKRCLGPCVKGLCTQAEYQEAAADVKALLEGKNKELAKDLEARMWQFSEEGKYELAAKYRDLRDTVLALSETQKMAMTAEKDIDIFGFYREKQRLALQLFTMREGKIVGRREFFWEDLVEDDTFNAGEFFGEVLAQYYSTDYVPLEIHVPVDFEDRGILEQALTERRGRRVHIFHPKIGTKRHLVDLVTTNAKIAFEQRFRVLKPDSAKVLEELQEILELPHFPERIESFDISNISGSENVAGIVVFENGKPARASYRRFIIKTVEGANDFASMHEAVFRRYRRSVEEQTALPQLIFIDGGKGQLSAAAAAMQLLDLEQIMLVGLVKPPKRHNEISHLLIYGREDSPIPFDRNSLAFRLILQIREETHKTAIEFHRKRREKRDFTSELSEIPGVGEKRKMKLLREFGSIERIAKLSAEEMQPFVGAKAAAEIAAHFDKQRSLAVAK